tara:strand:- start:18151 stop:18423 length:273 start_codon:yes stop_codon:yes gene_type:complete
MTEQATTPTPPEPKGKPFYLKPKFIMGVIAGVIFLILIFQNWEDVELDLFFITDLLVPAAIVYFVFSLIGFVVGYLVCRSQNARAKRNKK